MSSPIEMQIDRLKLTVAELQRAVDAIDESRFQQPLGPWSPRDIVAHLVGWNLYVIKGSEQIRRSELPFYDIDPGENYSKVNAELVRRHAATDRTELLGSLVSSAMELAAYLGSLNAVDWDHDYGVKHQGETLTIRSTVEDLIADYQHHRAQIETLSDP